VLKKNGNNPEQTRDGAISKTKCRTNFIIFNISNYKKKSMELMSLEKA
jgi:hypothetical protein